MRKTSFYLHFYESARRQTFNPAGATVSLVTLPSNMPIDFARKWTGGVCNLRQSIGIDNVAGVKMTKMDERTTANMDVVREETCRGLPHGGDHESQKYIAKKLMQSAKKKSKSSGLLRSIAEHP